MFWYKRVAARDLSPRDTVVVDGTELVVKARYYNPRLLIGDLRRKTKAAVRIEFDDGVSIDAYPAQKFKVRRVRLD